MKIMIQHTGKLLFLIGVLISFHGQAQDTKVGIRAGLNMSTAMGKDIHDNGVKPGAHAGFYLSMANEKRVELQPELLFSMKGFSNSDTSSKVSVRLYYIDLPILAKIKLTEELSALAGFQFSCLLNGTSHVEKKNGISYTSDVSEYRFIEHAWIVGLQYEMNKFNLGARFSYGIPYLYDGIKAHNANAQVTVGYRIGK